MRFCLIAAVAAVLGSTGLSASMISPLQCASPGSTTASPTDTTIHANSCTDFSYGFASPQTAATGNNWMYGYYNDTLNPAAFTQMVPVTLGGVPQGWWASNFYQYWTSLDAFGGHPNSIYTSLHTPPFCIPNSNAMLDTCGSGPAPIGSAGSADQNAVRRYVVPVNFNGTVDIMLQVQKDYRTVRPGVDGTTTDVILYHGGTATMLGSLGTAFPPSLAGSLSEASFPISSLALNNVTVSGSAGTS